MATTSIPHRWKYDVFVSFRGDDIRKNFMDHMFNDFNQKGIYAFRDDNKLPKGEEISPHLYKAIEESRFLIVIFSKNYASSSWCLKELVKILQCKKMGKPKHEVQIIFYDVKPDVVRKQTESYADAFAKHQDMTNGYEYKFIDRISKDILKKLCDGPLHVGENLVGIDFHFDKLNLSRFVGSDKVNMIGICGISVIGKTTLAKAIYNLMYVHFEGSCFCEDVKEVTKRQGLIQVQLHMIGKIMKTEDVNISGVGEGIMVIKQRMACKPILLVLDDVDHRDQLKVLAGSASWFCPGSLIIFTGKDKQLLRSHRVDEIHDMKFLDEDRYLQLFSLYAFTFEGKNPSTGFEEAAEKVVKYVQGHPLALSGLNILLDIACVFVGENIDFVTSILDGCNFFADANMRVLLDKSLITISSNMSLQMHDLIQAMARAIVREESIMTGKKRRLLISSNVYDISGQNKILKIYQEEKVSDEKLELEDHNCLRRLKIMKLRYCCNLTTSPDFSEIINLEELDIEGCVNLVSIHPSIGMLKRLVVLNLRDCKRLQNFPSRLEMDALQILNLTGCLKVDQLPEALGGIKSLTELHVDRTAITELPFFFEDPSNSHNKAQTLNGLIRSLPAQASTTTFAYLWGNTNLTAVITKNSNQRHCLLFNPLNKNVLHILNNLRGGDPMHVEYVYHGIGKTTLSTGTTSSPKGVVYSHRGAYLNSLSAVLLNELPSMSVYLWTVPMFHCNGWCLTWAVAAQGGTIVCLRAVNANDIFECISRHKVTRPGGAPPPSQVVFSMEQMGFEVYHSYGLTETYGPATVCTWKPWNSLPPDTRAKIKSRQGGTILGLEKSTLSRHNT
ncbi:NB-ARC domains-containing protein [Tanacetum coccineum]